MTGKIQLGYWKIRGLAQPIRLLLAYCDQDFENIFYEQGDAPDFSREAWFKEKQKLGLAFPNLPYLIDGDIRITQSNAILRYLGYKHDLLGETDRVRAETEMMLEIAMDFRTDLANVLYSRDYDKLVDGYFQEVDSTLSNFNNFLQDRQWFAGGQRPTACDFPLYELLDQHRLMRPQSLASYKNLLDFLNRFEQLPKIKEYMSSPGFMRRPVNNTTAGWK